MRDKTGATILAFFDDNLLTGCIWLVIKPAIGISLIIAVYFRLAKGVRSYGEPPPSPAYWIGIAALCALAAWCFLSLFA